MLPLQRIISNQGRTYLYMMKFKILFFFVCAPILLCGQQFLDVKVSSELDFRNYPPSLNIEFGKTGGV